MKTMTCRQLDGGCDEKFQGNTFDEIAEKAQKHAMQKFSEGDKPHLEAMEKMRILMEDPEALMKWFEIKKKEFDELPED